MQCQLYCTGATYCDFIVWLKEDIHIERIYPETEFMSTCVDQASRFFKHALLPELIGKFFSRPSHGQSLSSDIGTLSDSNTKPDRSLSDCTPEPPICYCRQPPSGRMVGCDNKSCKYEWFHFECLKLHSSPKRKRWYCPDCRKSCRNVKK